MRLLEAFGTVVSGMGVVFAVLILICLIIYCFNIIPYIENKIAEKNKAKQANETVPVAPAPINEPIVTGITGAEVAAIVAAIEAYTGMNSSEFVVRKIVRR